MVLLPLTAYNSTAVPPRAIRLLYVEGIKLIPPSTLIGMTHSVTNGQTSINQSRLMNM